MQSTTISRSNGMNQSNFFGLKNRWMSIAAAGIAVAASAGAAWAAPEMVVRVDGQEVFSHDELYFPDTPLGESRRIVVVLRNESNESLEFSETPPVIISGGFPEQFELIQPLLEEDQTLSPNGSTAFAVDFEPDIEFANLFTHVYIYTNETDEPFHMVFRGKSFDDTPVEPNEPEDVEPNEPEETEPNYPVEDEPNYADDVDPNYPDEMEPNDGSEFEPNEPFDGEPESIDDSDEPNDTGAFDDDQTGQQTGDNDGDDDNQAGDTNTDDQSGDDVDDMLDELDPLVPVNGVCGFGAGFASMLCFGSLGGARVRRKRK